MIDQYELEKMKMKEKCKIDTETSKYEHNAEINQLNYKILVKTNKYNELLLEHEKYDA